MVPASSQTTRLRALRKLERRDYHGREIANGHTDVRQKTGNPDRDRRHPGLAPENLTIAPAKVRDQGVGSGIGRSSRSRSQVQGLPVAEVTGHGELRWGQNTKGVHDDPQFGRLDLHAFEDERQVHGGRVVRIAAARHFEAIADAVAVRVEEERVGVVLGLTPIEQSIAIGVGHPEPGTQSDLIAVGQTVTVGVLKRIDRIVGVEAIRNLNIVRNSVAVAVRRGNQLHPDQTSRPVVGGDHKHRAAQQGGEKPVGRDLRDLGVRDPV